MKRFSATRRDFLLTAGAAAIFLNAVSPLRSVAAEESKPADRG